MRDLADVMGLDTDDLNETDRGIITLLGDGRCSPRYIASELDKQQPYISQRLKRLVEHGHVKRVDRGLYELTEAPAEEHKKRSYRARALAHYGEECSVCGDTENILVHHRDGDRSNNELSNLIPLCEGCHGKVHGRSDEVPELVRELGYKPRSSEKTNVRISSELADKLYEIKGRSTSYEDVIWDALARIGELEEQAKAEPPSETEPVTEPVNDNSDDARKILEELDLPGSGRDYERRVESVLAIYGELRSNPGVRMSKSDFRAVLDGQDVGYAGGFDSLWSNWVKSNPAQGHSENVLCSLPGVELRGNDYVYTD